MAEIKLPEMSGIELMDISTEILSYIMKFSTLKEALTMRCVNGLFKKIVYSLTSPLVYDIGFLYIQASKVDKCFEKAHLPLNVTLVYNDIPEEIGHRGFRSVKVRVDISDDALGRLLPVAVSYKNSGGMEASDLSGQKQLGIVFNNVSMMIGDSSMILPPQSIFYGCLSGIGLPGDLEGIKKIIFMSDGRDEQEFVEQTERYKRKPCLLAIMENIEELVIANKYVMRWLHVYISYSPGHSIFIPPSTPTESSKITKRNYLAKLKSLVIFGFDLTASEKMLLNTLLPSPVEISYIKMN